jgi:tetratricopeptide (TPR) repeat protein
VGWIGRRRAGRGYDAGLALLQAGSYAEAVAPLRDAVRSAPGWADAHNALGIALSITAQPDEALGALDRALELNPEDVEAHSYRARALAGLGYYDAALDAVRRALALKPGYTLALQQRALVQERMRAATASGLAVGRRQLDGDAAADDAMWGPALRAFETRISDWARNREAVIAMWLGAQAAAQTVLEDRSRARDFLRSANSAILEEFHHAFARRMVVRFAHLARQHQRNLTRAQRDEWLLLLDDACGVFTTPAGLVETHLLDRQFEFALEGPDDSQSGTGARNLEPALTMAIAYWILGPTDRPNIPRDALPAEGADQFVQRGGGGLPYDQRDIFLAHHALEVGEEALRRTFDALTPDAGQPSTAPQLRTDDAA